MIKSYQMHELLSHLSYCLLTQLGSMKLKGNLQGKDIMIRLWGHTTLYM